MTWDMEIFQKNSRYSTTFVFWTKRTTSSPARMIRMMVFVFMPSLLGVRAAMICHSHFLRRKNAAMVRATAMMIPQTRK